MAYSQDTYIKAQGVLQQRREKAIVLQQRHREECYKKFPELEELQRKLNQVGLGISRAFLNGGDRKASVDKLSLESLAIQEEREFILKEAGLPKNYLNACYTCEKCEDRGVFGERFCSCHKQLLKDIEKERIQKIAPIDKCSFEAFNMNYYSDEKSKNGFSSKELAQSIINGCKRYAMNFTTQSASLLLMGGTGLGKTHLSLAVANGVINKGYGVIYGTSQNILSDLESVRFNRNSGAVRYEERELLDCDLFIVDDLGTEFITPFTISCIYNIINSRLLAGKPTIISTNLSTADLERIYDQRITSRLISDYTMLKLTGGDIRQIKKRK